MSNRTTYIEQLFRQTRQIESEWFESDNLDEIKLIHIDGLVMVENEHGTIFDLDELSDIELDVISTNLENTKQYIIDELYYVVEKQTYDDDSPNGLVNVQLYFIEDNKPLKFNRVLQLDSDNVITSDLIREVIQEEGYYIDDVELTQL
jgi:hypothetical protein